MKNIKKWITEKGEELEYKKIKDDHLLNILKFIKKRCKSGVTIVSGGFSWDGMPDGDCYTIYGKEVEEHYDYKGLYEEAKMRRLI